MTHSPEFMFVSGAGTGVHGYPAVDRHGLCIETEGTLTLATEFELMVSGNKRASRGSHWAGVASEGRDR